jgi:hypothetical protein
MPLASSDTRIPTAQVTDSGAERYFPDRPEGGFPREIYDFAILYGRDIRI